MAGADILYQTFEMYLAKAKQCHQKGETALAKKYYVLAAEQMVKLAKESKGDLQKVRYQRAVSLMETAKGLSTPAKPANKEAESASSVKTVKTEKITLEEALENLNSLEGLENVKRHVAAWLHQVKVFRERTARNLAVPDFSYHMVFTGNPGTGKTTVARIMAQICCALGLVSDGHLVEVEKADLVAGYVGQTAPKTQEVIKKALGGVLFIDEAYSITDGGQNSFGEECVSTLLKGMEDNRDNLVVIAAGYEGDMEKFVKSNPGLRSRFKTFVPFNDYTAKELFNIFQRLCVKNQYKLTDEAREAVAEYFNYVYETRDDTFANGRTVRNFFESVVTRQSSRIARMSNPTDEEMITIIPSDLGHVLPPKTSGAAEKTITPPAVQKTEEKEPEKPMTPEDKVLEDGVVFDSEFKFDWDTLPCVTFDDVAGLDTVKETVQMKVLLPLKNPEAFEGYVKKSGGGLLLYGPPGTGKTMIAAAIANEINAKFCSVKPSDLLHQGAGQSEKAIRALFAQARQFPCAVVYFDEMDSISPKNTRSQYAKQLRSEFLAQLQGVESYGKGTGNILFLIAATNKPWDIDSAFIRPGRFGTRIYVGLPDEPARRYMVESRLAKLEAKGVVKLASDIDYDGIVSKTEGFNCSDITNLMDKVEELSISRGVRTGEKSILAADFERAFEEITSSVQRDDIEKLMDWTKENN